MGKMLICVFLGLSLRGICLSETITVPDTSQVAQEARNIKGYAGAEWGMTKTDAKRILGKKVSENWFSGELSYKEIFYKDIKGDVIFHFNSIGKLDFVKINTNVVYYAGFPTTSWEEFTDFYEQVKLALINKYGAYSEIYEYPHDKRRPLKYIWRLPYTIIFLECEAGFYEGKVANYKIITQYQDNSLKEIPEIQKEIKGKF